MELQASHIDTPVKRFKLVFNSKKDYEEAVALCQEHGFIRFYNEDPNKALIDNPVRAITAERVIEVDAAEDTCVE